MINDNQAGKQSEGDSGKTGGVTGPHTFPLLGSVQFTFSVYPCVSYALYNNPIHFLW